MRKFLSCDWGTTSFRLRLIDASTPTVWDEVSTDQGTAAVYEAWLATGRPPAERATFYKGILKQAIKKLAFPPEPGIAMILSGMASSSVGIQELPYQKFPFHGNATELWVEKIEGDDHFAHPLYLISGFRTETDVMRGEETMLLGCDMNRENTILLFPGTHSKHVMVKGAVAIDFKTYTTGEVFSLLAQKSILSNSVAKGVDPEAFDEGVRYSLRNNLLHSIFLVRTRQLLQNFSNVSNYEYLSGLLIGAELQSLIGVTDSVGIVGEGPLSASYWRGLKHLHLESRRYTIPSRDAFVLGHQKVIRRFEL